MSLAADDLRRSATGAALGHHVTGVVGLCPKKQMCGIHAGRIVATMEHAEPFWDFAAHYSPRNAMSKSLIPVGNRHYAIAEIVERCRPQPTPAVGFRRNFRHQSLGNGDALKPTLGSWHGVLLS